MSAIDFSGKWKLDRAENVDEWLKVFDVNMVKRKAMATAKPVQEITQDGDTFTITMSGPMGKMHEETFKLGEEHKTTLPFGVTVIGTPNRDGDKLVVKAKSEDGKHDLTITREMIGEGEMKVTSVADDVTCLRFFKKE